MWIRKPYYVLLLLAILVFAWSFIDHQTKGVNMQDTHFNISQRYIYWGFSVVLLVAALLYRLCHSFLLSTLLSWLHIAALFILLAWIILSREYTDLSLKSSRSLLYILIMGNIVVFPVNAIGGLLRKLFRNI